MDKQPASENNFSSVPTAIIIGSVLISLSILLGTGVIRIKGYNPSTAQGLQGQQAVPDASVAPQATPTTGPVKVAFDNSPVLGNKNAQVAVVEFSDYECPFCKRYFDETYSQIKKDYIDTGKVKLVFRNLPLSFHQNAHKQAQAALCARDQGGDETYFKYHDEIFKRTKSNGTGLAHDQLPVIAQDLGLNVNNFNQCLDTEKYVQKVDKDIEDATSYGATGTPSFFIGKVDGEAVNGQILVGAQPYTSFKAALDKQLAQ
jgi:protein-disulfide isomerase